METIRRARLISIIAAGLAVTLSTAACSKGGTAPAPSGGGSGDTCAAEAKAAATTVLDAVAAHRACTTDADCVMVEVNASCFDVCTRAVAHAGVDAVQAARTATETGACATFAAHGCKLITPPCAPPAAPTCVSGACE
jgi:hypothetical protein